MGKTVFSLRYVEVPNPRMSENDLLWNSGLCRCNQVKMRLYWVSVDADLMTGILTRRGRFGVRHAQEREKAM